jgi:hypothetical protein
MPPVLRSAAGCVSVIAAIFFGVVPSARAVISDHHLWVNFAASGPLLPDRLEARPWRLALDTSNRFANDARKHAQGVLRFCFGYMLNAQWGAWAGYSYTHSDTPWGRVPYSERAAVQYLTWTDRAGDYLLASRFRFDERVQSTGHDLGFRIREQFRVSHAIPGIQPLSWLVWDEVFLNLNATDWGACRGLDQNRSFAGFGWQWSETARSEAGYLHHFTNKPGRPDRVNHVFVLSLMLTFR